MAVKEEVRREEENRQEGGETETGLVSIVSIRLLAQSTMYYTHESTYSSIHDSKSMVEDKRTYLFHSISLLVQLRISKFLAQFQVLTLAHSSVRKVLGICAFFRTAPETLRKRRN